MIEGYIYLTRFCTLALHLIPCPQKILVAHLQCVYVCFCARVCVCVCVCVYIYIYMTICSNWTIIDREIRKLTKFLQRNCFPSGVIAQTVKDVLDRFHSSKTENYDVKKKEYRIVLPFLGNESFCIKTQLIKLFAKCYPQIDLKVVFTCKSRIGILFQVKDFVPTMSKSHLIYKISCEACHASYVGKTINTLNERFLWKQFWSLPSSAHELTS